MPRYSRLFGLLPLMIAAPAPAAAPATAPAAQSLPTQLFIAPSGEPFRAGPGEPYPVAAWFAGADRDHDRKLVNGEFLIDAVRFFDSLDLDHDKKLSGEEITRYENEIAPEVRSGDFSEIDWNAAGGRGQQARRPKLGVMQVETDDLRAHVPQLWSRDTQDYLSGGGKYGIISIPQPVKAMDTDLNGIVTATEMRAAVQRRFRMLDTEERNYLELAKLPETYVQRHTRSRKR